MAKRRRRGGAERWSVYETPDGGPRPEDRAVAGDPLPVATPQPAASPSSSSRSRGPRQMWRSWGVVRRALALVVAAVVFVGGSGLVAALVSGHASDGEADAQAGHAVEFVPFMTQAQLDDLVRALVERTGSSKVLEFHWYFGSAALEPAPAKGKDVVPDLSYDGEHLTKFDVDAVKPFQKPFDLRSLDVAALGKVYRQAWDDCPGVRRADSLSVEAPDPSASNHYWVWAYVDEADQTFYSVEARLDGTITSAKQVG